MVIIKLSGKALHDKAALLKLFTKLQGQEAILVHGGGVEVDSLLSALNFTTNKINGIRVSPKEQMPYITAVLAGQCNKELQAQAVGAGFIAQGLLASDLNMLKLKPMGSEYGNVATCEVNDITLVRALINSSVLPIVCSIGIHHDGELYNINADEVASSLAIAFRAPCIYISDVPGVLDDKGEVIPEIDESICESLVTRGIVTDGMLVKVKSALQTAKASSSPVYIASLNDDLLNNLFSSRRFGSSIHA